MSKIKTEASKRTIEFYKFIYCFRTYWTLKEASYLVCGINPDKEILNRRDRSRVTEVKAKLEDLSQKKNWKQRMIKVFPVVKEYNVFSIMGDIDSIDCEVDKDFMQVWKWARSSLASSKLTGKLDKAFYLRIADVIKNVHRDQVINNEVLAKEIKKVADALIKKHKLSITLREDSQIKEYLKSTSDAPKGRPKSDLGNFSCDIQKVISKL